MLHWFYVFAGWWSFCLSKTEPKRRNILVSILLFAEPSDGRSSSRLQMRLSSLTPGNPWCCFGTRVLLDPWQQSVRDDHGSGVHACQITCKWRRMPRGTSGLSVACARDLASGTVSGGALRVQRKIWAAADFQNFLTRPNTRRPRKKAFFSWSTWIWLSEEILKFGRGPNFSLHARARLPADRASGSRTTGQHRSWTLPKCESGRRFVDREKKKDFANVEKSGFVKFLKEMR